MTLHFKFLPIIFFIFFFNKSSAQEPASTCKVELARLSGKYSGKCKNGFADGEGTAIGGDRYEGNFKYGLPNGKGTYHYSDSVYHVGNFQAGIKEGKGETHYLRAGLPDSIIKGYWSADVYRGKQPKTYNFVSSRTYDSVDIIPTEENGNTITIELATTSGNPDGSPSSMGGGSGYVLTLVELSSTNGGMIRKLSDFASARKASYTYNLSQFPAKLFATLSDGQTFELELYKAAKWTVRLYLNK